VDLSISVITFIVSISGSIVFTIPKIKEFYCLFAHYNSMKWLQKLKVTGFALFDDGLS